MNLASNDTEKLESELNFFYWKKILLKGDMPLHVLIGISIESVFWRNEPREMTSHSSE